MQDRILALEIIHNLLCAQASLTSADYNRVSDVDYSGRRLIRETAIREAFELITGILPTGDEVDSMTNDL